MQKRWGSSEALLDFLQSSHPLSPPAASACPPSSHLLRSILVIFLTFITVHFLSLPPRLCPHPPFGLCLQYTLTHTWPLICCMYDSWGICVLRSMWGWKQLSPLPLTPHLQGGINKGMRVKGEWQHDVIEHCWLQLGWEVIQLCLILVWAY